MTFQIGDRVKYQYGTAALFKDKEGIITGFCGNENTSWCVVDFTSIGPIFLPPSYLELLEPAEEIIP